MIISFAHTSPALLAGAKTVTRRDWTAAHAAKFRTGMLVDAWDHSPRVRGRKVATIRLTKDPYVESSADALGDFWAEGFGYLEEHGAAAIVRGICLDWVDRPRPLFVVRFELVSVEVLA